MFITVVAFLGNVLGTFLGKLRLMLMKMVHLNIEKEIGEDESKPKKPLYCRGLWWLGFGVIMLGVVCHVFALPYTSLVLITASLTLGIVFNTLLSIRFLGEQFIWKYDLPALSLLCLGALFLTLFSVPEEQLMTYD